MKRLLILALAAPLCACASGGAANGPARLAGQELDAAVALYGPWTEQIDLAGQPTYIWRRTLLVGEVRHVCELRVQLGYHRTIRTAIMQGLPDACALYAVRTENLTK
jgi:hypothetical protein